MDSTHCYHRRINRTWIFVAALFSVLSNTFCSAQELKRALFLGNSYTAYNNLPQLTADVALSAGDTLVVASSNPGGYTFENHLGNATSMNLIAQGEWDFVVLQQQSQMPAFPISQVETETFPFATQLNDSILAHSPCAETVFYMTWGRENGDQQNCANWPPVCTYEGMDDLLRERYMMMAEMNEGIVSPVSVVWRYLRENHPDIQLFASDGSHPSPEGSYVAALSFYTAFFRKSPLNTSYNFTIADSIADILRNSAHEVVFNQLSDWYIGSWDPIASGAIEFELDGSPVLINTSVNASELYYAIDSGAYTALTIDSLTLAITDPGEHTITIIAAKCGAADTASIGFDLVSSTPMIAQQQSFEIYPNPTHDCAHISIPDSFIQPQLTIYHSTGLTMLPKTLIKNRQHVIDCAAWPTGVYLVSIQSFNKFEYRRLVIE